MKRTFLVLVLLLLLTSCNRLTDPLDSRTSTLTGVVKDSYGNVWGGVSIGLVKDQGVEASGLTGDGGRYTIRNLHTGHYRVWLQLGRTGQGSFVGDVDLQEGTNTFDIVTK
jgi:hypothetical protein